MLTPAEMGGSCQRQKAVLVIAKLDRLARRVSFVSALMDGDVDFVTCDFPQANRLTLHMPAAVAEHERAMISERTKADRSEREKHLIPGIDIRRAAWQMIRRY